MRDIYRPCYTFMAIRHGSRMVFDPEIDCTVFKECNWHEFMVMLKRPFQSRHQNLQKEFDIPYFVDSDHAGDKLTY
jgi:hypothetical protein